jgi:molecular chaperone HtpG
MKQTQAFQAEIKTLLDLMIHSLYSHKEIFLRELISNASDAMDKRKFLSLTDENALPANTELAIELEVNAEQKVLKIIDNGIGMSYEETEKFLGTIAHSGTKELLKHIQEAKDRPELIGQFGVGFYSSFMVGKKVSVHTLKAGTSDGVLWESEGDGTYNIDKIPRAEGVGTTITIQLKTFEGEEQEQDYTSFWTLKGLIKKYSDFIRYPIKMKNDKGEVETLNSQKALWLKSPAEVKEEEYNEFYQQLSHDWQNPAKTIHFKAEGTMEFQSLLYIPSHQPWNYYTKDIDWGPNLYIKRVFIMNNCEDLLPRNLRFVKGIVDSSDLSLNVSREILQKDRRVISIKKSLVNKVFTTLKEWQTQDRKTYETFWTNFGSTLKEGLIEDASQKEKVQDLILFPSTFSDVPTTLKEYVSRKKEDQKSIYFLAGDKLELLKKSPYLEKLKSKGIEVLFCIDPVDEWVMPQLDQYEGLKLVSLTKGDLDIDTEEEKKEKETLQGQFKPLLDAIKGFLETEVKDVRISDRLTSSAACLVSSEEDPSAHMQKLLEKMGQNTLGSGENKRILEINPNHPIFAKMSASSQETQQKWSEILYYQALIFEGSPLPNPQKFSEHINDLMIQAQIG